MAKFLLRCYGAIRRKTRRAVLLFANSASLVESIAFFSNEILSISQPDPETKLRRALLAPYGDWPNEKGLQRFRKEDAQNIVNAFNSIARRAVSPQSWLGLPWYEGHPDHPSFRGKPGHTNMRPVGRIKGLEACDDGLYANVRFNPEGERFLADEIYGFPSTNWMLNPGTNGDKGTFRPCRLKSVGFTNEPNIPVPAVTTANAEGELQPRFQTMVAIRGLAANTWSDAAREASAQARKASESAHAASALSHSTGSKEHALVAAKAHKVASEAHSEAADHYPDPSKELTHHIAMAQEHSGRAQFQKSESVTSRHQAMAQMRKK